MALTEDQINQISENSKNIRVFQLLFEQLKAAQEEIKKLIQQSIDKDESIRILIEGYQEGKKKSDKESKVRFWVSIVVFLGTAILFFANQDENENNRTHYQNLEETRALKTQAQLLELEKAYLKLYELAKVIEQQRGLFELYFNQQQKDIAKLDSLLVQQNEAEKYWEAVRRENTGLRQLFYNQLDALNVKLEKPLTIPQYDSMLNRKVLELRYRESYHYRVNREAIEYLKQQKFDTAIIR